jgi:hypothetical protein
MIAPQKLAEPPSFAPNLEFRGQCLTATLLIHSPNGVRALCRLVVNCYLRPPCMPLFDNFYSTSGEITKQRNRDH